MASAPDVERALGSLRRAFSVVRRVTGTERWDAIGEERTQDLLAYLALDRFGGRPKLGELPNDLQADIKAFCGSYKRACTQADELLFSAGDMSTVGTACGKAPVGKVLPDALYVHESALGTLPTILRVYEGCARQYIGAVEGANIIKLSRTKPQISYLSYPDFDRKAHPALAGSLKVPLQTLGVRYRDYSAFENPPILHRKELFVAEDYEGRAKFAKLTAQEEKAGLLDEPRLIGFRNGWDARLVEQCKKLRGHRLQCVSGRMKS